jgi:hypothetical protein
MPEKLGLFSVWLRLGSLKGETEFFNSRYAEKLGLFSVWLRLCSLKGETEFFNSRHARKVRSLACVENK